MKLAIISTVLVSLASSIVHAQPVADDKKVEAKAHYEKGNTHYNLGEFDKAIEEFKAAYALTSAVGLLFNIAQSYRLKKDYENASYFYKTYLRLKPDAPNKSDVEDRIKEMDALLEEQKKQIQLPPTGLQNPDGTKPPERVEPTKPVVVVPVQPGPTAPLKEEPRSLGNGKSMRLAGLTAAGAGVALVITGAVFGSLASSAEADLNALSPNMGTWTAAQQDTYDHGKRDNTIAIVSLALGGAGIATGGVLYYLGYKKDSSSTTVAVRPSHGGASFSVGWRF
ncbi:MAG: tetratricopeptide repeat protein [Proteobacteria bacterium]|nr:tetratricopeptide repeat protein [Pseudomonadota bacterium]